ncbi:hypothetical protein [Gordonia caeni]|uniref:DUF4190 domain-containing protein n=1 Tax=Gordonia caeni TaxID=1007097 RepID=A0ABP7PS70_9ACTN
MNDADKPTRYYDAPLVRKISTVAVILGIASVLLCWIPIIAPFAGLIAIILGFIGREKVVRVGKTDYLGASHLAIVTGVIGLIIGVVFLALSFGFGPGTASDPEKDDGLSAPAVVLSVD